MPNETAAECAERLEKHIAECGSCINQHEIDELFKAAEAEKERAKHGQNQ